MSLEAKIESLTAALSVLNETVSKFVGAAAPASAPAAAALVQPAAQPRQRRAAVAPVATPEPAAEAADDGGFLDEPAPVATPEPEYTLDQVRAALVAFQKATNSQEKARKLLKDAGGVDTLQNLPKDKYGAVIKAAKI